MTLITSISGIRGTIGGRQGEGLTPPDVLRFVSAYVRMLQAGASGHSVKVVVGRDGRTSGPALNRLVCSVLQFSGADVIDLGLSTTPSVEMAVTWHKANGGIILTASHNGAQWNALKLLNGDGEFISDLEGKRLLDEAQKGDLDYPAYDRMGEYTTDYQSIERHVDAILENPLVNVTAIRQAGFRVAFDGINSTGGIAVPLLLKELGVEEIFPLNAEPTGRFSHNPEPLPEHITDLVQLVVRKKADVGFVVDPDVDRLAIVCEDGSLFGEEYTLVAVADYVLSVNKGDTVSNLSSSRALRTITEGYGCRCHASAVGEVNVVAKMKEVKAVIGGEGNGGVILPDLHYGRDALAGIALFLTHLALKGVTCSALRASYPQFSIRKNRMAITPATDFNQLSRSLASGYPHAQISYIDGVKIDLPEGWVHLRKSNTEPIIRIYSEAATPEMADQLAADVMKLLESK
jgi:phosphomannomutase